MMKLYQALDPQDRDKLMQRLPAGGAGLKQGRRRSSSRYRTVYQLAMEICEEAFSPERSSRPV